jgi:hypothetical protein
MSTHRRTSAPETAASAGLEAITGRDGQPAERVACNEDVLNRIGAGNRLNDGRFAWLSSGCPPQPRRPDYSRRSAGTRRPR